MTIFHPLHTDMERPLTMNNPLNYEPHPLCQLAVDDLLPHLPPIDEGKMYGVLVVEDDKGQLGYIAAFSGQINGRSDMEGFVPPIVDYLQPDGYFKTREAEISKLNQQIGILRHDERLSVVKRQLDELLIKRGRAIYDHTIMMHECKEKRKERRRQGNVSEEEKQAMIRESQFQKAELHRLKLSFNEPLNLLTQQYEALQGEIDTLRELRKQLSEDLQQWLFSQFVFVNVNGESRDLLEIFAHTSKKVPPSGAGECCEPKLLHYALTHGYKPLNIAMFWHGPSPKTLVRHHLQYYPACRGKCLPILAWVLQMDLEGKVDESKPLPKLDIIYEDDDIIVVNKQPGLLSVPGRIKGEPSVYSLLCEQRPHAERIMMVHRLDQLTSGLLIAAKNKEAHKALQEQFEQRLVKKQYVAILSKPMPKDRWEGTISLPLRPSPFNEPYQEVNLTDGKVAVTEYRMLDERRIMLFPHTGRTHQLRVHCAHHMGLDNPIVGDGLYGKRSDRLYLHAERIEFCHPITKKPMTFHIPAAF
ncbi:MAG: RluA family pseudouridine synthase [Prevotella sp.]|nr:RluA family pseudouridine synthase [Prevotella sp.]